MKPNLKYRNTNENTINSLSTKAKRCNKNIRDTFFKLAYLNGTKAIKLDYSSTELLQQPKYATLSLTLQPKLQKNHVTKLLAATSCGRTKQ